MIGSFRSEWVKLRRPGLLFGTLGAGCLIIGLITYVTLASASGTPGGHGLRGDADLTVAGLSEPDGIVGGLRQGQDILGLIALVVCAQAWASEHSLGTLRNLLLRQPRRVKLLAGKQLALFTLIVVAALLASITSIALALLVAPGQGIVTSSWSAGEAIQGALGLAAVMLGYGLLGATLGLVLRSPALAIGIGAAYVLPIDWILSGAWPDGAKWLLGSLTESGSDVSLTHDLIVLAVYGPLLAAVAVAVFRRRDVLS